MKHGPLLAAPSTPPRALPLPKRAPPRRVDHTYRDYSNFLQHGLPGRPCKKSSANFPGKLHLILSSPEHAHIISWMPHGRAWKVHDKELLVTQVITKYFVQSKYESFTRQLTGWGFKRLHQAGNDYGACYHPCFLRGLPHLTPLLRRTVPNQGKLLPHVEAEPNFYEIQKQSPLPAVPYPGHGDSVSAHQAPASYRATLPEVPAMLYHYVQNPSSRPPPPPYYGDHCMGLPLVAGGCAPPPHPEYPHSYPYPPTTLGGGPPLTHGRYPHRSSPPGHLYDDNRFYHGTPPVETRDGISLAPLQVVENQEWDSEMLEFLSNLSQ